VQTQQTGGVFLKVADIPSALASLPQLIAQSLDMRLFTEALVLHAHAFSRCLCVSPDSVADKRSRRPPGAAASRSECCRPQTSHLAVIAAQQHYTEVQGYPACGLAFVELMVHRKIFFARDKQGKAALRPSLATMEALVRKHLCLMMSTFVEL
jgi:hypothetical protein